MPSELKIKYLSRRLEDIEPLRVSLEQGDFSYAQRVGHQVKGNAVTFQVPEIAWIGTEMEKAALVRDEEKVRLLIQKMEKLLLKLGPSPFAPKTATSPDTL